MTPLHPDVRKQLEIDTRGILNDMYNDPMLPAEVKGILDSTSGTTGSVLIRQDLDTLVNLAYVTEFPGWARLPREQANGLVHAWNIEVSPITPSIWAIPW